MDRLKQLLLRPLTLKNTFTLLGFIALLAIAMFNRRVLVDGWHLLHDVRWYVIVLIVAIQFASYWLNALYYRSILGVFNSYELSLRLLFEAALATNYVSYTIPSVGAAGAGYLSQILQPQVNRGESVLAQLMRSVLDALALLLLMPVGIILLITGHRSHGSVILKCLLLTVGVLLAGGLLFWLVRQETALRRFINHLLGRIKRRYPQFSGTKAVKRFVDSFYQAFRTLFSKKKAMLQPFIWSVLYVGVELLTLYMVFLAFGRLVNPGVIIIAYLIANISSIFGGLLFSVGAFEFGMAATFIALGVASSVAFSITVLYRSLNLVISLPPGFYYYRKYLP